MEIGKMQNGNMDDAEDRPPKLLRLWELYKIGNFDEDSWNKIFENLANEDLATVACVCKKFRTMAENIFAKRHRDGVPFCVSFSNKEWKPVIYRFSNVITNVTVSGPEGSAVVKPKDFNYFVRFLSKTLKVVRFYKVNTSQWQHIKIRNNFRYVEELTFHKSQISMKSPLLSHIRLWFPYLESLQISRCNFADTTYSAFFKQMPSSLVAASFYGNDVTTSYIRSLLVFFHANPQLKHLFIDLCSDYHSSSSSRVLLSNVQLRLRSLESLQFCCSNFTVLQSYSDNFESVKKLGFTLKSVGTYKNELLKIFSCFPILKELKVLEMSENLMTNDDLIDLLTESSSCSSLNSFIFTSYGAAKEIKFGCDLHSRVCDRSNRSNICIKFEFGTSSNRKHFKITKEWIKKCGENIVVSDSLNKKRKLDSR